MTRHPATRLRGTFLTMDQAEQLARARADSGSAAPARAVTEPTLPSNTTVPMVTLSTDELHDLIHAAASTYLHTLSAMGRDKARLHAGRIAAQADLIVHAEHTVYRGDRA